MSEPIYLYCSNPQQYEALRDALKELALQASRPSAGLSGAVLIALLKSLAGIGTVDLSRVLSLNLEQRMAANAAICACLSDPLSESEKTNLLTWLESSGQSSKVA